MRCLYASFSIEMQVTPIKYLGFEDSICGMVKEMEAVAPRDAISTV